MHPTDNPSASTRNLLSRVRALQARRHLRDASGVFWIEGIRQFVQACDARLEIETIVHSEVLLKSSLAEMLARRLASGGGGRVRRLRVSPEQFRSICTMQRASGIAAIARQRWTPLERLDPRRGLCRLVIESIRSDGNLGTILRTAEAAGAAGVIFLGGACDPFAPAVVRASMGGIFPLELTRATPRRLRRWADTHGVRLIALSPRTDRLWTDLPPDDAPVALLLGEERRGVSHGGAALCDMTVSLPMTGRADSINVAVASGVMLYELVRRARGKR